MSGSKKSTQSNEDRISHLPDTLIHEILCQLPIKDIIRTSVFSKSWRNHWLSVPRLDLDTDTFPNSDAFRSFGDRVLYYNKESLISKLCLRIRFHDFTLPVASWIDSVIKRRIQYLDVDVAFRPEAKMPLSVYTSETLVHLRLGGFMFPKAEFVYLPCLKMMHLDENRYPNETTLEKLISGSPVLEDLVITSSMDNSLGSKVVQVRSRSLKRVYIDKFDVVIDAPLLECFKTRIFSKKKFKFVDLGFSTRLDFNISGFEPHSESFIRDILTDISKVRDLTISDAIWKGILLYTESRPLLQFQYLTRLNAKFSDYDLEMLPTILESCPILESLTLELVRSFHWHREPPRGPPNAMITTVVPQCFISSLKFVELIKSVEEKKRSISRYKGEIELVRYFLENSTSLEKLKLNISLTKKVKCDFLKEVREMQVCSSVCEVVVV